MDRAQDHVIPSNRWPIVSDCRLTHALTEMIVLELLKQ